MRQLLTDLRGNPIYQSNGSWRRGGSGNATTTAWRNQHLLVESVGGDGAAIQSNPLRNPRSLLFLYVTSSDWNNVIRRAQSHPLEVMMVDDNLNTPLHRACQLDPPVDVVMALQDAASQINSLGATPLHIAASSRCNGRALQTIISLHKGALSHRSRMGRTPIHYACMSYRGLDLVAFQTLLEATLEESRNRQQQQQHQHNLAPNTGNSIDDDDGVTTITPGGDYRRLKTSTLSGNGDGKGEGKVLMIADFIDVLRREHDGLVGDRSNAIDDDEDLSVLVVDDPSTGFAHMSTTNDTLTFADDDNDDAYDDEEEEDDEDDSINNPNKDNPHIVTWKDSTGNTPLSLLFRRYRERVKSVISVLEQMRSSPGGPSTPIAPPTSLQTDLGHLWGKARLIVARLTEEQQQQMKESTEMSALGSSGKDMLKDDSSSSGSSYGGHLTAAAAWSSERCNSSALPQQGSAANFLPAMSHVGYPTGIRQNVEDAQTIGPSDDAESGSAKQSSIQERQFRIVHASVALAGYGCPPEMIRLAVSIHPHQVMEMDEDGNLPLHIAATAASFGTIPQGNCMPDDVSVFSDGMASLFSSGSSKRAGGAGTSNYNASFEKVIKLLLKQYPQAAQTPHGKSGRLPLVLAARAGNRSWGDGMKALLRAYPPALFSGNKGLIPIKLYAHVLCLIGGGPRLPTSSSILSPDSAHSAQSATSSNLSSSWHRSGNSFKGIGFLHNLLLSKQRHIRERASSSMPLTSITTATAPPRNGRPRKSQNLLASSSSHSQKRGGSGQHKPSTFSRATSNKTSSSRKTARQGVTPPTGSKSAREAPKVDSKLATTVFELLRTKPDLVEVGRRYEDELMKEQGKQQSLPHKKGEMAGVIDSNPFTEVGKDTGKKTKYKRTISRKIFDRISVFERKTSKGVP